LLFGSGFCALVYQVAWLRDFRLIFGASTAASAAVLAIFIGGLGAGGLLLGPRADRHARPLVFYSYLESIVALSAAATPLLLAVARSIYLASGGSARLGGATATFIRLALSVIVLGVPTVAIGGTLPAAARAATRAIDARRRDVAALYALNTLGARRLPGRNVLVAGDVRHALDALARSGDQPARGPSGAATRSIVVG